MQSLDRGWLKVQDGERYNYLKYKCHEDHFFNLKKFNWIRWEGELPQEQVPLHA